MAGSSCYAITTARFGLRSGHDDWLRETQDLYNAVLEFYYHLYLDRLPQERNSQSAMRQLEKLTIVGRDRQPVEYPIPWEKVPLYFRRAAINAAVAAGKSFLERDGQRERTVHFDESVTFYKGMYRDFCDTSVSLKVWTGASWKWLHCRLSGNRIPDGGQSMSPSVVLKTDGARLHVPVKIPVEDGRTASQRMEAKERVCSVIFTNRNATAVCCILDEAGNQMSSFYIKGGREYAHLCAQVLQKIGRSKQSSGEDGNQKANRKYWTKLKHLNEHYSHMFSRKIVDYCLEHGAKVLVLPKFAKPYSDYLMISAGNWSPLHLSVQIREKVKYKAWQRGIVVLEADEHYISTTCSVCGAKVKRSGSEFCCEQGHRGDAYLNMARNLGNRCCGTFGKRMT